MASYSRNSWTIILRLVLLQSKGIDVKMPAQPHTNEWSYNDRQIDIPPKLEYLPMFIAGIWSRAFFTKHIPKVKFFEKQLGFGMLVGPFKGNNRNILGNGK